MEDLNRALARYRTHNASEPKGIVIPMAHRQAIKVTSGGLKGKIKEFMGIPVLPAEEIIVIRER